MDEQRFEFTVSGDGEGQRVDKWLSMKLESVSRSHLEKLFESGAVLVNGKESRKNFRLNENDRVQCVIEQPQPLDVKAQNIPIDIVYEDSSLLVVNKPKGMVVHPAAGNADGTLVNALLYHCDGRLSSINGVIRPGIVHRIDKMTSGLLMIAKTDEAHRCLAQQIKEHSFLREYQAVVTGTFEPPDGIIDAPIGRSRFDRKKMWVTQQNSKNAMTHYQTLEQFKGYSLVSFKLETGRTHQIRVHCAYKGHPILGDDVYGKAYKGIDGQCLHAKKLGFVHPNGEYMEFDSELPPYFTAVLDGLRK
ncbi:MAG: RluA family pseudouridine synthase [Ruminococcus sp.]|nr:RluA family pseudouridine synthase [Ruminococcus sp.]